MEESNRKLVLNNIGWWWRLLDICFECVNLCVFVVIEPSAIPVNQRTVFDIKIWMRFFENEKIAKSEKNKNRTSSWSKPLYIETNERTMYGYFSQRQTSRFFVRCVEHSRWHLYRISFFIDNKLVRKILFQFAFFCFWFFFCGLCTPKNDECVLDYYQQWVLF